MHELFEEYEIKELDIFEENLKGYTALYELNNLSVADKIIFMLYCELRSYRKVATYLGVPNTSIAKKIKTIKETLIEKINSINFEEL